MKINNGNTTVGSYILAIGFLICISLPILDYPLKLASENSNTENRKMNTLPEFNLKKLDPFPKKMDDYYSDNFRYREDLLELNSWFMLNVLNLSPIDKIIVGKEGWFYHSKFIHSYINKKLFTSIELDSFKTIYSDRTEWLAERGIKHYVFVVPNKPQIYPEYLPDYVNKINAVSKTEQFIKAVSEIPNLKVHYLKQEMLDAKKLIGIRSFHKTDEHWNEFGGLVGLKGIINVLAEDFPNIKDVDFEKYKIDSTVSKGKSLVRVLKKRDIEEMDIKVRKKNEYKSKLNKIIKYPVPKPFRYKNVHQIFKSIANADLPKALIIRDSFTNSMKRELNEYFEESCLIWDAWCYELHKEMVKKEKPDIYLTIIIESNLPFILYKHPTMRKEFEWISADSLNKKFGYL